MRTGNVRLLQTICTLLPAATMAAAHWFPWRRVFKRDLHQLEAYTIGTTAIVGTAAIAISVSDGDRNDHAAMLLLAAGTAGAMTVIGYAVDEFVKLRADLAALSAERDSLDEYVRQESN